MAAEPTRKERDEAERQAKADAENRVAEMKAHAEVMRKAALLQLAGQIAAGIEACPTGIQSPEQVAKRALEIASFILAGAWGEGPL